MARKDFKGFRPKADRDTYKPKGETKQGFVERVHDAVLAGETIGDMWRTYYENRFGIRLEGGTQLEPYMVEMLRDVFYAGVASMFHLMNQASEGPMTEESIEEGAARMQRLHEELDTYTRGLR